MSNRSTAFNPGAFNRVELPTFSKWIFKSIILLRRLNFRKFFFYVPAELLNLVNIHLGRKTRFHCNVCQHSSSFFLHHANELGIAWFSICPNCNSRSRHRGLFFIYTKIVDELKESISVLHFAPEPVFYPLLRNKALIRYHTSDFFLQDVDFKEDIQNLSFPDATYDLILCNHVIEHVPDDDKALKEIGRILKPKGKAIITIPGNYKRAVTVPFKHLRYNGHYRDYGLDVIKKMERHFQHVQMVNMHIFDEAEGHARFGIRPFDLAFICNK